MAVQAWQRLGPGRLPLVVVGEPGLRVDGVIGTPLLSVEDWATVLAGADVFVYPTRYEGWGMPATEAATSGTPVVCARVGPLPEVLGDAAEWCEAPTVDAVAAALARVMGDEGHRLALRQAGLAHAAAQPGWEAGAANLVAAYEMAAGR